MAKAASVREMPNRRCLAEVSSTTTASAIAFAACKLGSALEWACADKVRTSLNAKHGLILAAAGFMMRAPTTSLSANEHVMPRKSVA